MKYFWNKKDYDSYEDLLSSICDCIYTKETVYEESYGVGYCKKRYPKKIFLGYKYKLFSHYELTAFFKDFRHNENDGIYHKEDTRPVYGYEYSYNEAGRKVAKQVLLYHKAIPAWFEQKRWIVIDSYGRIINSKDLKIDALKHNYDPNWKDKFCKPRKFNWPPCSYRNGNWQRYLGDHAGPTPAYRKAIHHSADKKEIFEEYGISFKVRGKRLVELRNAADWDGRHGWIEKGWKQTRKHKQWS